jgi:hypothetical protein
VEIIAQIRALSEGYVLESELGSVACTNGSSLLKAIKDALTQLSDRGKVVAFPSVVNPTPNEVRQALANDQTAAIHQAQQSIMPTQGPPPDRAALRSIGELPPEQIKNLYQLADACFTGKLATLEDVNFNLAKYVPDLAPDAWHLFISEYIADRRSEGE